MVGGSWQSFQVNDSLLRAGNYLLTESVRVIVSSTVYRTAAATGTVCHTAIGAIDNKPIDVKFKWYWWTVLHHIVPYHKLWCCTMDGNLHVMVKMNTVVTYVMGSNPVSKKLNYSSACRIPSPTSSDPHKQYYFSWFSLKPGYSRGTCSIIRVRASMCIIILTSFLSMRWRFPSNMCVHLKITCVYIPFHPYKTVIPLMKCI